MKQLTIKKLSAKLTSASEIPARFAAEGVAYHDIEVVDWANDFPYCPKVSFAVAHQGDALLIHYRVQEESVRAVNGEDLGSVWEDSCCEFFLSPDDDGSYYNLETNCIGTVLLCNGEGRERRVPADESVLKHIDRWASLGRVPFGMREGTQSWELALIVPVSSYFRHHITDLSGMTMRGNFYKCGDKTQTPHFVSWNPIEIASPDFHRPDFFGELIFE